MKHFFLICFIVVLRAVTMAQSWTPMNSLPGLSRFGAASTQTTTHGYVLGGVTSTGRTTDCWSYEPIGQVWNQIASYPGEPRSGTISFSYNDIVYYGWGDVNGLNDSLLYSYNPMTNEWTEITGAPAGINSWSASCFMIDSKAYIVTFNNLVISYDCNNGVWQQHGNFPGPQRSQGSAFALNGAGYFGLGYPFVTPFLNDFWKYDPLNDSWTEIPGGFPGTRRYTSAGTATSNFGYILCGESQESPVFNNDVWRFDPTTETFQQLGNFPANRNYLSRFVLDGTVYAGCGGPGWNASWWSANLDDFQQPCNTLTGTLQNGLVGYWPFCGNANDESGNGNDGVVSEAVPTNDRYENSNSAYEFDGINDVITVEATADLLPSTITISCWVKHSENPTYDIERVIRSRFFGYIIYFDNINQTLIFHLHHNPDANMSSVTSVSTADWTSNEWHNITGTFDGITNRLYIDGVLMTEQAAPGNSIYYSSDGLVVFGRDGNSEAQGTSHYTGDLDDIGIWNRALTAEEITQLYGNFTQPIPGCTDLLACNYNSIASEDDGSCQFPGSPCDDADASTINDIIDASCGCTGTPIELGVEHTCGAALVHNPSLTYGSMTDQEGNVYKTIVIGDQEWMAENLNTSIYRNGEAIPTGYDFNTWGGTTSGSWSYYNDNANGECPFGKLYNWYTVADSRQLCPSGWHVPTEEEWNSLIDYLGGYSVAGGKMKSTGNIDLTTGLWYSPNGGATNSSGFSGLPGGDRNGGGAYYDLGLGVWWTSTTLDDINAYSKILNYTDGALQPSLNNYHYGFSVRCMNDEAVGLIPGCTDLLACNYNSSATEDDGSCQFSGSPCDDANANTYNDIIDASCGCTGTPIEIGVEHTCGAPNVHNPNLNYGSVTDQEGNVYKTIVIGDQEWMAENLNTSIYRNGDAIATGLDVPSWSSTTEGAWAFYNNDPSYECPYGKLYNWYSTVDPRELCPAGWHAPSNSEYDALISYLGGGGIAGGKMKSVGVFENTTGYWLSPNTEATNTSGFSALPGGYRYSSGEFVALGGLNILSTTTESEEFYMFLRFLGNDGGYAGGHGSGHKRDGFSVRCLRDANTGLIPGCTDLLACNYNPDATEEDGSCYFPGCIDPLAFNYNPLAGCNDGSCIYTQIPGCTDPIAFNYNPQANQNEGCLYTASVFVYNDLNGNGEHESNEPGLANWPVVGNDINGLLWTNGNGNAFVAVPQGAYQFTVLNTTDNWVSTTPTSATLDLPAGPATASFGLQVIPGEAIVAAGPFTGFWDILHCTDGYESGVYLENIGSQTVSGFMTLTCDPLFTPNASSYFTTPPAETGPGYALWNIADFLPGEYELLSYFVPGPGVEYLNAVFNFSLELTLLDPQGNIIYDETWDASPIVACAYDPNDLTGYPEGLDSPHDEGYTIEHFMRPDNMVEFRVRFQNTGTLPAEDIDIYIPIDASVWDLSTIEPLARAADMQVLCLHDDGSDLGFSLYDSLEHELPEGVSATDLLIFSFEDIFLPDSASDPDGSQGYVFFQMQAKHGLVVNTELNAQAFIYFEQNPPITTNETYHVIFDCESFTPMVGDAEICDGESLIFDATQPYVDTYEWQLNNVVIGSANTLQYPAEIGTYTLELNTKNVLCPQGENHDVTVIVHEIPELNLPLDETVCEGDLIILEAEYDGMITWSNGLSTGDTLIADTSFTVTITVVGEGGCSISEDWSVTVNPLPNAGLIDDGDILVIGGVAWQWYFNGEEILGATANSISPDDAGNYYVVVTGENGCVSQSETVVIPTNIFVHSWSTLHLYPNPMTTGARLELPQGTFDVALYDITGACIRTLSKQQGTVVIERESLASGVYQLQVSQGEVMKSVRLVVE